MPRACSDRRSSPGRPPRPPIISGCKGSRAYSAQRGILWKCSGAQRHVEVGGEHRRQQRDQPQPAERRVGRGQHAGAAHDLGDAAQLRPPRGCATAGSAARSVRRGAGATKWLTPAAMKRAPSSCCADISPPPAASDRSSPGGCSMPSNSSTVGATSARMPPLLAQRGIAAGHDQRHRVQRVGGVGAAVGLEHVVGVAVVGGHDAHPAAARGRPRPPRPRQLSTVSIGRHRRLDHAGVPDHVGVGEVDDREARAIRPPARTTNARRGLGGAHLRLVVVGGDVARRGHQLAALARPAAPPRRR